MLFTMALVSPKTASAKVEEPTITPNKKNKALSSLKERRRRQNDACRQEAHNTKASYGGASDDDDGIAQIRNMLSEDCSDMKLSSTNENVNGVSCVRKDEMHTNDDRNNVNNGGNNMHHKPRSLCTGSIPPQVNDADERQKIPHQSSSVQRFNRTRLRMNRLREEKNEVEESMYDLNPTISDLSIKTASLYPHGETMTKSTKEVEKQLKKETLQIQRQKKLVDDSAGELNPLLSDSSHQTASKNDETSSKKLVNPEHNRTPEKNLSSMKKMGKAKGEPEEAAISKDGKYFTSKSAIDVQRQHSKTGSQQAPIIAVTDHKNNTEKTKHIEKIEREFQLAREEDRKVNENLRIQLGQLKKRLEQRDIFIEQVKNSSLELEKKTKDLLEENDALHDQIDQMSNELNKCQNIVDQSFEENQDLIKRMQTLEINFQRKEEKLKKSVEKQLSSIQKDVVKAVNDLKLENIQKDNKIELLDKSVEDRQRKIDMMNEQLVEYKEKVADLTDACEQLGKKFEKCQLKNEMLEEKIEGSKKKNQTLKEAQDKRRSSFEKELYLQQQKYDKIVKETKDSYLMREEQIKKALQIKLSNEHTKLKEFQREEEKKYTAREEELKNVLESQIEKLQTFYDKEITKAEEESKRSLEEAREEWLKQHEDKLKEQDAFYLEIQDKLQHETENLREELKTKDALMKEMQKEIDSKTIALEENEKSKTLLSEDLKKIQHDYHLKNCLVQQMEQEIKMKNIAIEECGKNASSLSKHIGALEVEKDQIIQSLKEDLENELASREALSKLTGAAIKTLKEELDEKQSLLEHLNTKEIEMSQAIEKKDRLIQCLAERLEINQLAVESLTLSIQARDHEASWKILEENVSNKSKGEIASQLRIVEKENSKKDMGSFRLSTEDVKDFKIAKYESELRHFKTWIETRNSAENQSELDTVVEPKNSLKDKSDKLEQNVTKLQETINAIIVRNDTNTLTPNHQKKAVSPAASTEKLQEYDPANFMRNELNAHIPEEKVLSANEEAHDLPDCVRFDEEQIKTEEIESFDRKSNIFNSVSAIHALKLDTLNCSNTPKDAHSREISSTEVNSSLRSNENDSNNNVTASDMLETTITPEEACRIKSKVWIGIRTALSSNSMATNISKSYSDASESTRNDSSLIDSILQSSDSEVTESSEVVDHQHVEHISFKNEFMSGVTPKARPGVKTEAFPTTPKGKATRIEFSGEEKPSVRTLPEGVESFSQSSHDEPDNSTAYGTANGCDRSMPSSQQTSDIWSSSKSSHKPSHDSGSDEFTSSSSIGAEKSLGINPILSSESSVSDCTFESHTYSRAAEKQHNSIQDLLATAKTPINRASFDSVEDKIRSTMARWESIQASCLREKCGDSEGSKERDEESVFFSFSAAGSSC